jgi:hypothetical protein
MPPRQIEHATALEYKQLNLKFFFECDSDLLTEVWAIFPQILRRLYPSRDYSYYAEKSSRVPNWRWILSNGTDNRWVFQWFFYWAILSRALFLQRLRGGTLRYDFSKMVDNCLWWSIRSHKRLPGKSHINFHAMDVVLGAIVCLDHLFMECWV